MTEVTPVLCEAVHRGLQIIMGVLQELVTACERNEPVVLATVIEVNGASPAKVGAKILVRSNGATVGTAGGGRLEQAIVADAHAAPAEGKSRLTLHTA